MNKTTKALPLLALFVLSSLLFTSCGSKEDSVPAQSGVVLSHQEYKSLLEAKIRAEFAGEIDQLNLELIEARAAKKSDSLAAELAAINRLIENGWGPCCGCNQKTVLRGGGRPQLLVPKAAEAGKPATQGTQTNTQTNTQNVDCGCNKGAAVTPESNPTQGLAAKTGLPQNLEPRKRFFEVGGFLPFRGGSLVTFGQRDKLGAKSSGYQVGIGSGQDQNGGTNILFSAGADATMKIADLPVGRTKLSVLIGGQGRVSGGVNVSTGIENVEFIGSERNWIQNSNLTETRIYRDWYDKKPIVVTRAKGVLPEGILTLKAGFSYQTKEKEEVAVLLNGGIRVTDFTAKEREVHLVLGPEFVFNNFRMSALFDGTGGASISATTTLTHLLKK